MMTEEFRPILGFEHYHISNLGNVILTTTGQRVEPYAKGQGGYLKIALYKQGKRFLKYVHRIVLEVFVRPPKKGEEGDHINAHRSDCRLSNLRWLTRKQNAQHRSACILARNFFMF